MSNPKDLEEIIEKESESLEKRLRSLYQQSAKELTDSYNQFRMAYAKEEQRLMDLLDAGEITEDYLRQWRLNQLSIDGRWRAMLSQMATRITKTNETACEYINSVTTNIFRSGANFEAYSMEMNGAVDGFGMAADFTLVDEATLRNLSMGYNQSEFLVNDGRGGLTYRRNQINPNVDYDWNTRKIQNAVTSAIMQGKDMTAVAESFYQVMGNNWKAAVRNARTSITSAQNAGRQFTMQKAQDMGIELKKRWLSTKDNRTRDSHAWLDGETVSIGEKFSNGLEYPADPNGEPAEVYNCRCTMISVMPETETAQREFLNYNEWLAEKNSEYIERENDEVEPMNDQIEISEYDNEKQNELTDDELWSIEYYVSGEGMDINNFLRERAGFTMGDLREEEKERIKLMDSAIEKSDPVKADHLYRTVDASAIFSGKELRDISWNEHTTESLQGVIGKTIEDNGFMSTTRDLSVAEELRYYFGAENPIIIDFRTSGTVDGFDVGNSKFEVEDDPQREVILARGCRYTVTSVKYEVVDVDYGDEVVPTKLLIVYADLFQ